MAWIMRADSFCTSSQGNLKAFTGASDECPVLVDELALAICEHHTALEHLCLQQQFNSWSVITSALLQQPHAQSLRAFPVSSAAATPAGPVGCVRTAFSTQQCCRSSSQPNSIQSGQAAASRTLPRPPINACASVWSCCRHLPRRQYRGCQHPSRACRPSTDPRRSQ